LVLGYTVWRCAWRWYSPSNPSQIRAQTRPRRGKVAIGVVIGLVIGFVAMYCFKNGHLPLQRKGRRVSNPTAPKEPFKKCLRFMQREGVTRSKLPLRPRTKLPCKVQEQPEWEISEPSQGAQCARASREYRKSISAPSSIPAFSTCSSTTP
jgi:hypothetical protein